jgi:hypothetical protein
MAVLSKARVNGCLRKMPYRTMEYATMVARHAHEMRGVVLRVYHCDFGPHFHLTSKPRGLRKRVSRFIF